MWVEVIRRRLKNRLQILLPLQNKKNASLSRQNTAIVFEKLLRVIDNRFDYIDESKNLYILEDEKVYLDDFVDLLNFEISHLHYTVAYYRSEEEHFFTAQIVKKLFQNVLEISDTNQILNLAKKKHDFLNYENLALLSEREFVFHQILIFYYFKPLKSIWVANDHKGESLSFSQLVNLMNYLFEEKKLIALGDQEVISSLEKMTKFTIQYYTNENDTITFSRKNQ